MLLVSTVNYLDCWHYSIHSAKLKNLRRPYYSCHACTCWQSDSVACYFKPAEQPTEQPSAMLFAAFLRGSGQIKELLAEHRFSIVAEGLGEWVCSCIWLRTIRMGCKPEPMGRLAWVWFG